MTDIPEKPRIHEVRFVAKKDADDKACEKIFNELYSGPRVKGRSEIRVGPVRSMLVPDKWERRKDSPNLNPGMNPHNRMRWVEYHLPGNNEVRLNAFYRGHPILEYEGEAFRKVLAAPPHELDAVEIQTIQGALGERGARDEKPRSIKTENLNGKRVLVMIGDFQGAQGTAKTIFIDGDGTGTIVQELEYSTRLGNFEKYLPEAEEAFKSIQWFKK